MAYEVYEIDLSPVFNWIARNIKIILAILIIITVTGIAYIFTRPKVVRTVSYIRSSSLPKMQLSSSNITLSNQYIVHPKVVAEYIEANQKKICGDSCKIRVTLIQRNDYPIRLEVLGQDQALLLQKHQEVLDLLNKLPAVKYYQNKYSDEYKQLLLTKQQLLAKYKKDPANYADVIATLQGEIQMYEQALASLKHLNFWFVINPQIEEN